jgi:dTMP kinase
MFITFEGPDGSGKSTQAKLLAEWLIAQGKSVVLTREPGGSALGKQLRTILLNDKNLTLAPLTELLLFCADRAQHVTEIIKPALAQNKIVICDRYIDSTTAYQSGGRGFDREMIDILNAYSTQGTLPDRTFLIDVPTKIGLARATKISADKFESEAVSFHEKVRSMYLKIAQESPRVSIIDGVQSIDDVALAVQKTF